MKKLNNTLTNSSILRKKGEVLLKRKSVKTGQQFSEAGMLKLIHELQVRQAELKLQNEELILAKSAGVDAAQKYTELYDSAPWGYLTLTKEGKIYELNHCAARMLGRERSHLINSNFGFFVSKLTLPVFNAFFLHVFKSKAREICDVMLETDGNQPTYVLVEGMVAGNGEQCIVTMVNITGLRQVLKSFKESEAGYKRLFEGTTEGILMTDMQPLRFQYANPAISGMLGYTEEELMHLGVADIHPKETLQNVLADFDALVQGRKKVAEVLCLRKDGTVFDASVTASKIVIDGRECVFGFFVDISDRKLAEKRTNLSSKILNLLNNTDPLADTINLTLSLIQKETGFDAIGIRLKEGDDYPYFYQNGFNDDFLQTENTLIERTKNGEICRDANGNISLECTCGLVISGRNDSSNHLFTKGGSLWTNNSREFLNLTAAEEPRHNPRNRCIHEGFLSVAIVPIRANGKIIGLLQLNDRERDCFAPGMIQFFESMGEIIGAALMRKQAEDELINSIEQLRQLTQHIEKVREDERVAISRELHDDLGQALTAVKIDLGIIVQKVSDSDVVLKINKVSALVGETIKTVQSLSAQLRPLIIDDLGIEAAIEWYTKEFAQRNGIEVFLDMDSGIAISTDASLNIFRIVQESLTNIARHSRATRVDIGLAKDGDYLNFRISDNGIGISDDEIKSKKSFGIISMKERAASLGGTLDIYRENESGTVIMLILPLDIGTYENSDLRRS